MEDKQRGTNRQMVTKTVELKIAVPTLPAIPAYAKTKQRLSGIPRKKIIVSSILGAVAIVLVGSYFLPDSISKTTANSTPSPSVDLVKGTPSFGTVVPTGKNIDELGGWTRISPPDRNEVYAYVDNIDSVAINVSQQPLPESFKNSTSEKVEELALGFNASEKITVGSTTVYIGTSAQGPQSVIFSKNRLLILIKSSAKIDSNRWAEYVNQLR